MIADLKPFATKKNSGVPWLGEVPEHWGVRRIKAVFREKDERSGAGSSVLLSLTRARGIVPQAESSNRIASAEDLSKYKTCQPGDLVMNRMQAWSGMFGLSSYEGVVSPDYSVFEAIGSSEVKYFEHLFKTPLFVDQFAQRSKGVGSGFNRLYTPEFGTIPVVVPPLSEQAAIVRFLDHADRRVRHYIHAKQKLIRLLEEQKEAIINHAVTRGFDPNVQLKPSGVEWLGDVPEHWAVKPLKHLVPHVTVGIVIQPARLYVTAGVPCLRSLNISKGFIDPEDLVFISRESNVQHRKSQIFAGDIVVVRTGLAGVAAIVTPEFDGVNCIDLLIVRRSASLLSEYLLTYLNSRPSRIDVQYRSVGAIQSHYNTGTLANLVVAAPPIAEQQRILGDLGTQLTPIISSTAVAKREIYLLREYRARLIADVVTGKLDVRAAAAQLPDETDGPQLLDETDTTNDPEEGPAADFDAGLEETAA